MGMLNWLKARLSGDQTSELILEKGEEELHGLNLKEALDAHEAWNGRLKSVLDGTSTESIQVSEIAQDCNCHLGKWIYGPGKKSHSSYEEYEILRKTHAEFHLCAGEILMEHQAGNDGVADKLLKTKFRNLSNRIQLDLVRLFTKA